MTVLRVNTIAGTGTTFGPTLEGNLEFNSQNYIVLPKGSSTQEGVLRTTADVVGTGGTFYDNLVLAMPFNAATGLTDVSSRNRNPAAYGNVAISTAQSKYYGSSASFDGSGDYLRISSSINDFKFDSGNFTIETWLWKSANGGNNYDGIATLGIDGSATDGWFLEASATRGYVFAVGGFGIVSYNISPNTSQWIHLSVCKQGNTTTMYLNGVAVSSFVGAYTVPSTATTFDIGVYANNYWFNGYLQDLRIYKGLAKYTANFTPPDRIAELGVGFKAGQLRYNTDSNKVELYDGNQWTEVQASRPDLNGGARGVFGGGGGAPAGTAVNTIDYINISSTGNAQDFGDLFQMRGANSSCSSSTRGLFGGGSTPTIVNTIDYITIASTGNAQDFGDLLGLVEGISGCSSSTRGIFAGGNPETNTINFITIATLGNTQDFGDLTSIREGPGSCSNATRGLFGGGDTPTKLNSIDYITIATLGNAVDFGDLNQTNSYIAACSSSTRGVFGGGYFPYTNTLDYVTILTQGNVVDFGDLFQSRGFFGACSNAHGGL